MRLSIPVVAQPESVVAPQLEWRVERNARQAWLVATNSGTAHEKVTGIALTGADGRAIAVQGNASPYVLPGVTRRWALVGAGGGPLRLTAQAEGGRINQQVPVNALP